MASTDVFDQLNWRQIKSFIDQKQEETLHLGFKLVVNSELTSKDDKRNIARSISGFANSDGGIIIWGIDARKNDDGIDCATKIVELASPALLVTRLNAITGDATSPIVDGVRHKAILNPDTGSGAVATVVPESDGGPFMAKLGEHRYFERSGDSFYRMEHFDLEDMFGRRRKAVLKYDYILTKDGDKERLAIRLQNVGRSVAKYAGMMAEFENARVLGVHGSLRDATSVNDIPIVQYENNSGVIHPNNVLVHIGVVDLQRTHPKGKINVTIRMHCEGTQPTKYNFSI